MFTILKSILEGVRSIPWERVRTFLRLLYLQQPISLALCVLLLIASVGLGKWYWDRSAKYENIVRNTLLADMEPTPQRYKGLEAFLLSNIDPDVQLKLRDKPISDEFIAACKELQKQFQKFDFRNIPEPALRVAPGKNAGKIISDDSPRGFLFLPIYILRRTLSKDDIGTLGSRDDRDANKRKQILSETIKSDIDLKRDIAVTKSLSNELYDFTGIAIADLDTDERKEADDTVRKYLHAQPAQVYMITRNGINRIFNPAKEDPSTYYGSQFPATTFFPSRPYFWPVFREQKSSEDFIPNKGETVGEYFYVSRPYMDLGGNGIVITLARGLEKEGLLQAAICFDLPFLETNSLSPTLESRINELEGETLNVKCTINSSGNPQCEPLQKNIKDLNSTEKDLLNNARAFVDASIRRQERSAVFGNIQVINHLKDVLQISVPISEVSFDQDSQTAKLLIINVNLLEFRRKSTFIALAAATAFGIMVLLLAYLWGATVRHKKEYQEAFGRVASVMYRSPTPYVRLDSQDRIRDFSLSFCEKLGYPLSRPSVEYLKSQTFRSLCSDKESLRKYDEVQENRKNGRDVDPYRLSLKTREGSPISVMVVSADVPSIEQGSLPQTFGILLEDAKYLTYPEVLEEASDHDNVISMRRG